MSLECSVCERNLRDDFECDRDDCPVQMIRKYVPTSLIDIEINKIELSERIEIRLNWLNDRHHIVEIKSRSPHDVIDALGNLVATLEHERRKEKI